MNETDLAADHQAGRTIVNGEHATPDADQRIFETPPFLLALAAKVHLNLADPGEQFHAALVYVGDNALKLHVLRIQAPIEDLVPGGTQRLGQPSKTQASHLLGINHAVRRRAERVVPVISQASPISKRPRVSPSGTPT